MARRKKFGDLTTFRFLPGTFERMDRVLRPDEDRSDLVRRAVERELEIREAALEREKTKRERDR
jgi:hypothetical protein